MHYARSDPIHRVPYRDACEARREASRMTSDVKNLGTSATDLTAEFKGLSGNRPFNFLPFRETIMRLFAFIFISLGLLSALNAAEPSTGTRKWDFESDKPENGPAGF